MDVSESELPTEHGVVSFPKMRKTTTCTAVADWPQAETNITDGNLVILDVRHLENSVTGNNHHEEREDGVRRALDSRDRLCHGRSPTSGAGVAQIRLKIMLAHELNCHLIGIQLQNPQPVQYKDLRLDCDCVIRY